MKHALLFWKVAALSALLVAGALPAARADIIVPGADGSDGEFAPTANIQVDLGLAATAQWDTPSPTAGNGVYDPEKWAVVFKYQRVNIPANVTVTFKNHPANPPVVWLVTEDVVIDGTVRLDGEPKEGGGLGYPSVPGPGGFRGGIYARPERKGSGGFGPGGGPSYDWSSNLGSLPGGHSTSIEGDGKVSIAYGNANIVPLIGGSGGSGGADTDGGAGGGAFLIAAVKSVTVNGSISATGGYTFCYCYRKSGGSGSGGAIRIVSHLVAGAGKLDATGTTGRVRIEANSITLKRITEPLASFAIAGSNAQLWPEESQPTIRLVSIDDMPIPDDPLANLIDFNGVDLPVATFTDSVVQLESTNLSPEAEVSLFVVPLSGIRETYLATYQSTDGNGVSTWTATVPLAAGFSALQARAVTP